MRPSAVFVLCLFLSGQTSAFEPVSALDDGFAVPSDGTMTDASLFYPGAESYIRGGFAFGAWSLPYGLDELAVTTGLAGICTGKAGLSLSFSGSGFDLYGEEQEKLGLSYAPIKSVSTGLRVTRNAMRIKGFGHAAAWSADAGVVLHPCETVYLAGAVEDFIGAELGESCEPLDGRLRFASTWRMPGEVTLLASVTKVRRWDPSFSAGFTADILSVLTLGVMGANEPDRFEFLCGVKTKGAVFSYRGNYHRELGMTHGFSMGWKADSR